MRWKRVTMMAARLRARIRRGPQADAERVLVWAPTRLGKAAGVAARDEELGAVVEFLTLKMAGYWEQWAHGADEGNARIAGALRDVIGSLEARKHRGQGAGSAHALEARKAAKLKWPWRKYDPERRSIRFDSPEAWHGPTIHYLDPKGPSARVCPSERSGEPEQHPRGWERA